MKTIYITKIQSEYLLKYFLPTQPEFSGYLKINDDIFEWVSSEDVIEVVHEWALDKFDTVGMDAEYEVTHDGLILESIIDLFCI